MHSELATYLENRFKEDIRSHISLPASEAQYSGLPSGLSDKLAKVLRNRGVSSLYTHQAEAFRAITNKEDTVIVSPTASGKTLSFLLPILNDYLSSPSPFTVFLLYPTKALSRDQEGVLGALMDSAMQLRNMGTFDGDTPRSERERLQKSADFIITNPDMLHSGILPSHSRKWKDFLSRLKYIVVDEVHSYRGAFGSHVSNVFRRLTRVCNFHGSNPLFIASSATVGNPGEHVSNLFHREFTVINGDGAPRPERSLYFINPSQRVGHGGALYRKGPGSISVHLIRKAAQLGVRTICFCRARQEVERLYRRVCDGHAALKSVVKPYRGGLLPNERRALEQGLFKGDIKVIISTNALELGIDIGDLELCLLSGHPGSVSSFWQQAGRVGRKGNRATIIFIAKDSPVDQYLVHHPEFITGAPVEQAWLSADNPYVVLQHLPCAAHEQPLLKNETVFSADVYHEALELLTEQKVLRAFKESYRYGLSDYPARGVNLRGMTDYNIQIYCGTEVIGELDPIGARGTLYKDAIYQHLGRRYMSTELDLDKKICRVELVNVDFYTEAVWEKRIELSECEEEKSLQSHQVQFGFVHVNKQPKLYKKIRERSFENIGYGPITLPPFEYDTTGFCLALSDSWKSFQDEKDKRYANSALYGLAHLLRKVGPSVCMGDASDVETDVSVTSVASDAFKSALFLYDSIEGGVGYGEKVYELLPDALERCLVIINECECESGCPSCVPPLPPGIENEELIAFLVFSNAAVECAKSLLVHLISGELRYPEIKTIKRLLPDDIEPLGEDEEKQKLRKRLGKAGLLLKKKRERLH
ncbi:MAG: DEAD/DEAH box helicase [Fibrobacteria bacterium]|nr:DEAD/DEAH box helicase [Fibrobacteria bacterium]